MRIKNNKRARNLGDVRKLSEPALVNGYFDLEESTSRAVYHKVLSDTMLKDGMADFWDWCRFDLYERINVLEAQLAKLGHPAEQRLKSVAVTPKGEILKRELIEIAQNYDFTTVRQPARCREFCSEEGNVLRLTEADLTPAQLRMLKLLRSRCEQQLFQRGV